MSFLTPEEIEAEQKKAIAQILMLTTNQVAARLGLTRARIVQLCRAGLIQGARKVGRDWVVPDPPVRMYPAKS